MVHQAELIELQSHDYRKPKLARDALESEGYHFIGGYMSPVNDTYGKKGLIPANHRIQMCNLACRSSSFIMVDPWELVFNFNWNGIHRARDRAKRRSTTTSEPVEHSFGLIYLCIRYAMTCCSFSLHKVAFMYTHKHHPYKWPTEKFTNRQ
ncbi:hypothetical protein Syun_006859 [Stephania yunnanensis]|uniref:Uncharacterized protein n=1 Tax=Stephania yunnanensis TaxID=152371 RepID=A0AAP0KYU8_9MAGN